MTVRPACPTGSLRRESRIAERSALPDVAPVDHAEREHDVAAARPRPMPASSWLRRAHQVQVQPLHGQRRRRDRGCRRARRSRSRASASARRGLGQARRRRARRHLALVRSSRSSTRQGSSICTQSAPAAARRFEHPGIDVAARLRQQRALVRPPSVRLLPSLRIAHGPDQHGAGRGCPERLRFLRNSSIDLGRGHAANCWPCGELRDQVVVVRVEPLGHLGGRRALAFMRMAVAASLRGARARPARRAPSRSRVAGSTVSPLPAIVCAAGPRPPARWCRASWSYSEKSFDGTMSAPRSLSGDAQAWRRAGPLRRSAIRRGRIGLARPMSFPARILSSRRRRPMRGNPSVATLTVMAASSTLQGARRRTDAYARALLRPQSKGRRVAAMRAARPDTPPEDVSAEAGLLARGSTAAARPSRFLARAPVTTYRPPLTADSCGGSAGFAPASRLSSAPPCKRSGEPRQLGA
jgi:hypothetical protein